MKDKLFVHQASGDRSLFILLHGRKVELYFLRSATPALLRIDVHCYILTSMLSRIFSVFGIRKEPERPPINSANPTTRRKPARRVSPPQPWTAEYSISLKTESNGAGGKRLRVRSLSAPVYSRKRIAPPPDPLGSARIPRNLVSSHSPECHPPLVSNLTLDAMSQSCPVSSLNPKDAGNSTQGVPQAEEVAKPSSPVLSTVPKADPLDPAATYNSTAKRKGRKVARGKVQKAKVPADGKTARKPRQPRVVKKPPPDAKKVHFTNQSARVLRSAQQRKPPERYEGIVALPPAKKTSPRPKAPKKAVDKTYKQPKEVEEEPPSPALRKQAKKLPANHPDSRFKAGESPPDSPEPSPKTKTPPKGRKRRAPPEERCESGVRRPHSEAADVASGEEHPLSDQSKRPSRSEATAINRSVGSQ